MKLPKLEYKKAETLKDAMAFYRHYEGNALFLACGDRCDPSFEVEIGKACGFNRPQRD